MPGAAHIIRRQVIDIHRNGGGDGLSVQSDAERMWHEHLQYDMEALLDRYHIPGKITSLGRLEIEVTDMTVEDMKNGNTEKIIRKIEEVLQQRLDRNTGPDAIVQEISFFRNWLFYLEHGHLPWWVNTADAVGWKAQLQLFLSHPLTEAQLNTLRIAMQRETVQLRVLAQLDEGIFPVFISRFFYPDEERALLVYSDVLKLAAAFKDVQQRDKFIRLAKIILLSCIRAETKAEKMQQELSIGLGQLINETSKGTYDVSVVEKLEMTAFKQLLTESIAGKDGAVENRESVKETEIQKDAQQMDGSELYEEGIYVANAGIVVVAVYLPAFFSRMGLQEGKVLTDVHKCIALLNYLAAGDNMTEEFECVMAKILCGLMPDDFVDMNCAISEEEREMADELLQAVIANWDKLKNTSPDGLRNSFLKREGKLTLRNDSWMLEMQREAYDILLQFLPWSINMIKLPWMNRLLQVKWE
ncbi:contractile injection system tape measure protein [Chitinophagaceae bacterium MMS25-I14]